MGQLIRTRKHAIQAAQNQKAAPRKYLTFELGEDLYGLEVMKVKKIIEYGHLTHVPMMPEFIKGVLNLASQAIPVLDLALYFGEESHQKTRQSCIIIIELQRAQVKADMGVIVDAVRNVIELDEEQISAAPDFGDQVRAHFIHGIGRLEDQFMMLLDMSYVLSSADVNNLAKIKEQHKVLLEKVKKAATEEIEALEEEK